MLADALQGICAGAFEESTNLGVGSQAADEVVGDGSESVVSAKALVKSWLLRECGADEGQRDKCDTKEPVCVSHVVSCQEKLCLEGSTIIPRDWICQAGKWGWFANPAA